MAFSPIRRAACLTVILFAAVRLSPRAAADVAPPAGAANAAPPAGAVDDRASWSIPSQDDVRERVVRWAESANVGPGDRSRIAQVWSEAADDLLDRVVASIAVVDERVAFLASLAPPRPPTAGELGWLSDPSLDPLVRESVRLHVARHLVRCGLFDDASSLLDELDVRSSVDPATLLFLRATCRHWLLDADGAAEAIDVLLERSSDLPVRYERLATLMRRDLESLEDDSLDHISRRMRDITRRLSFGRAGPRTRDLQDGVIESLDKLIASIEEQMKQSQCQGGGAGGGPGSGSGSKPMEDSMPAGGKGPGDVAKRDIGDTEGWGDLPPRKRDEALQQIGREFPPHYREAIEQYFKRLASGETNPAGEPLPSKKP